ncbi:hypothetical protein LCGC14_1285390 [marine sediment metagenome]|uniref:Uncharacterized protein n=1 Tax=marine sediment metagenome TaxID=412755 RepID=A0A0F9LF01_9ZZZZ
MRIWLRAEVAEALSEAAKAFDLHFGILDSRCKMITPPEAVLEMMNI